MSKIKNEAKIKFRLIEIIRGQIEQRAIWPALLSEESEKKGLDINEFGNDAIFKCGTIKGKSLTAGTTNFKMIKKNLFSFGARLMFEIKIKECTDDTLSMISIIVRWLRVGRKWAYLMKESPCFVIPPCVATEELPVSLAESLTWRR
jgi:hypothetical protein